MPSPVKDDQTYLAISVALDAGFYRGVYRTKMDPGLDPIAHFIETGWREGLDPAPWFSTRDYLADHVDVADAGLNPFLHYLQAGRAEGRTVRRSRHAARFYAEIAPRESEAAWSFETGERPKTSSQRRRQPPGSAIADMGAVEAAFDREFYLAFNKDVAESGVDPLTHFLVFGWREGRDPSPDFSVAGYLSLNPDVAAAGINPLIHFLASGAEAWRPSDEKLGFRHDILASLLPIEDRLAGADRSLAAAALSDPARLSTALQAVRDDLGSLHIAISHDDYAANLGGVQICVQREVAAARARGLTCLNIFPATARPTLLPRREDAKWGVRLNGELIGTFTPKHVCKALHAATSSRIAERRSFAIHSLLGHHVEDVIDLVGAAGIAAGYFWLHDFTSVCAGVHLLRNDVVDCGAPPTSSAACRICIYGPYRAQHLAAHGRLFDALDLTVVAPSQTALDTWLSGSAYPAKAVVVHPHVRLEPRASARSPGHEGAFRFAYLGLPVTLKGWPIFREIAVKYADDPRYEFLHLGKTPIAGMPAMFHEVAVSAEDPDVMRAQIEAIDVDAVMLWSLCRETFSFAAYEAAAAGAAIVTGPDSGNIAAFVLAHGHGLVLDDVAALDAAFASGKILELARLRRRPQSCDLVFSALTVDLLTGAA